jgi:hypothetical protein
MADRRYKTKYRLFGHIMDKPPLPFPITFLLLKSSIGYYGF